MYAMPDTQPSLSNLLNNIERWLLQDIPDGRIDTCSFDVTIAGRDRRPKWKSVMEHPLAFEKRIQGGAPFLIFSLFIVVHPLAFLWLIRFCFGAIWRQELAAGVIPIMLTFALCHLVFAFGEFFFHRYILHILAAECLKLFYGKHLTHHTLTAIYFDEPGQKIKSLYPVGSIEQDVCGTFPPWALILLLGGFTPVFLLSALLFPHVPICIGGYCALTLSYYLYEAIHVTHHRSYDAWWKKRIHNPITGPVWRTLYGFHQAHHANYRCNMNVAGFFGLPVGDWLFATYKQPDGLLLDETPATKEMIRALNPEPYWPVSRFDQLAQKRKARILST